MDKTRGSRASMEGSCLDLRALSAAENSRYLESRIPQKKGWFREFQIIGGYVMRIFEQKSRNRQQKHKQLELQ